MKAKKPILIFLTIVVVIGNITKKGIAMGDKPDYTMEIKEKFNHIDLFDGVSKEEAIIIAQNDLLNKNEDQIFNLKSAEVFGEDDPFWDKDSWHISFKIKSREWIKRGLKWCTIHVDKKTGHVKDGGCGPS